MKKVLFATLGMSLAFAACTNEELVKMEVPAAEGELITLGDNFAIGVTEGEPVTRAQYVRGAVTWLPALDAVGNPVTNKIGLSWKGQMNDGKVYTNYLFESFAWPKQWAATPEVDPCTGWTNLVFFNKGDYDEMGGAGSDYVTEWETKNYITSPTTNGNSTPDVSLAYFKTSNLTIFGGDYIVYYPYDETFVDAGYLYAKSNTVFNNVNVGVFDDGSDANRNKMLQGLADELFYVAATPEPLTGGSTANAVELQAVSGTVYLRFTKDDKKVTDKWEDIIKVAIYSEGGIVYEQAIDAKDLSLVPADKAEVKKSTSLMANLKEATELVNNSTVVIPMLPQTIKDAVVVVFDSEGKSADFEVDEISVDRGGYKVVDIALTSANKLQDAVYYVVDMETFQMAMTKAAKVNVNTNVDIRLLNDITFDMKYTSNEDGNVWVNRNMTISGGDIIVPAGQVLSLQQIGASHQNSSGRNFNLTINSNITLEDACCNEDPATVSIFGIENTNPQYSNKPNITINGNIAVETAAQLNIGLANNMYTNISVNGIVENAGTLTVDGNVAANITTLTNKSVVDIKNANTTPAVNKNVVTVETLTTEKTVNVGAYTELVINTALTNSGTLNIAKSGVAGSNETDGTVTNKGTAINKGYINNEGVYDNFGTTALEAGSKFTDYVGSQYGVNMPTVKEGAEYICIVNTSDKTDGDRLGYALGSKMPTTTVRFETAATHEYQLKDYYQLKGNKLATVKYVINTPDTEFVIKNAVSDGTQVVFGKGLTVEDATSVTFNGYSTKVDGDVDVVKGKLTNNGDNSAVVEVAGNLYIRIAKFEVQALKKSEAATESTTSSWVIKKDVQLTTDYSELTVNERAALDVSGNLIINAGKATFAYSSYSDIAGTITNMEKGTFTRVLSSGTETANPAQVWCTGYDNRGTQQNAGPQVYIDSAE